MRFLCFFALALLATVQARADVSGCSRADLCRITKEWFACPSSKDYERSVEAIRAGDTQGGFAIAQKSQCILIKSTDTAWLTDRSVWDGTARIRLHGTAQELWTGEFAVGPRMPR